jgi:hypothetical protein
MKEARWFYYIFRSTRLRPQRAARGTWPPISALRRPSPVRTSPTPRPAPSALTLRRIMPCSSSRKYPRRRRNRPHEGGGGGFNGVNLIRADFFVGARHTGRWPDALALRDRDWLWNGAGRECVGAELTQTHARARCVGGFGVPVARGKERLRGRLQVEAGHRGGWCTVPSPLADSSVILLVSHITFGRSRSEWRGELAVSARGIPPGAWGVAGHSALRI